MTTENNFVPHQSLTLSADESLKAISDFESLMDQRRSVRTFSSAPVDRAVIESIIRIASSAPSGAHKQPWTFCAISNPEVQTNIRKAAEKEEYENYHGRMSEEWLDDLQAFGTDWKKPFLEVAPWLIVIFKKAYDLSEDGTKTKNYYVNESVGIAAGFLISAIHKAGLVTLTHTPSPMNFLQKVLDRPENERPFLLLPVGYAAEDATVPVLERKGLDEMAVFY
ncbi:MAG: nitroreductase family protein [Saprospiraceae bacterium]